LPYFGGEKSTEEIHQILIDAHLYPDEDLLELVEDLPDYYDDEDEIVINEEEELEMDKILNLNEFVNTLEDIIEDSNLEEDEEAEVPMEGVQEKDNDDIIWDPAAEADKIIDSMN
jgi:uncharacterized Ntn-hydrolase superfamily protein